MTITTDSDRIERALRTLGPDLLEDNCFAVTGLPSDASPRQVRRAREESRSGFYVPPSGWQHAPIAPSDDADRRQLAFDQLQDPLVRLVHELTWIDADPDSPRSRAAVELAAVAEETRQAPPRAHSWGEQWTQMLETWARLFGDRATWDDAADRVRRIDDPRLTSDQLAAIVDRLPARFLACLAETVVRVAREQPAAGKMLATRLRDASRMPAGGFRIEDAEQALCAAVEEEVAAVEAARKEADAAAHESPHAALAAAERLLQVTRGPFAVIDAVIGDGPIAEGAHDQVALTALNNVAMDAERVGRADLGVLRLARPHARTATVEQLFTEVTRALQMRSTAPTDLTFGETVVGLLVFAVVVALVVGGIWLVAAWIL